MDNIKDFTASFFQNLNCCVEWKEEILHISRVPKDFEEFSEKKSPYSLIFDKKNEKPDAELISSGSFLLKKIRDYLESKSGVTLIKIDFQLENKEIEKKLNLKNSSVHSISKKADYKTISRFSFSTICQYLNEKENIKNTIIIKNKELTDIDLSKLPVVEGKKDEIESINVKEDYELAKEHLKDITKIRIQKIKGILSDKLESEIERINQHYGKEIKELEEELNKNLLLLKDIQSKKYTLDEKEKHDAKIKKIKENSDIIKAQNQKARLEKEKQFFINDEINKHNLNISNKLSNTTVIYYPVFHVSALIKNNKTSSVVELEYNPLEKKFSEIKCNLCEKTIQKLFLCSSGHISCEDCLEKCGFCKREFCKKCIEKKCSYCRKNLCKKCIEKCKKCMQYFCREHMKKSRKTGQEICINCAEICSSCRNFFEKENILSCSNCFSKFCRDCSGKNFKRLGSKILCHNCLQQCQSCEKLFEKKEFVKCGQCNSEKCSFLNRCNQCRKKLCLKLSAKKSL